MIIAILAMLATWPVLAFDVPVLKGRVNDYAKLLTPSQIGQLETKLKDIESGSKDGAQLVVLTLPSLNGESVDAVRNEVFRARRLGQAGKDNGVLVLIAPTERKIAIEVGYGLEPVLPDSATSRITEEKMKPHLKRGSEDWFKALDQGAEALGVAILGREKPAADTKTSSEKIFWLIPIFGTLAAALGLFLATASRRRERERAAAEHERARRDAAREADRRRNSVEDAISRGQTRFRPLPPRPMANSHGGAFVAGAAAGLTMPPPKPKPKPEPVRRSDDSPSYRSSSDDSGSSYSSSSSDSSSSSFSGGGGDSGGGGSSSDF
jgi:uncharacterized protein